MASCCRDKKLPNYRPVVISQVTIYSEDQDDDDDDMSGKTAGKTSGTVMKPTENDIEKGRHMGEWRKVLDSLEASRTGKTPPTISSDGTFNFFFNESKLEIWLEEHQPTEKYIQKARISLTDIKKGLQHCISGENPDVRVLLAKINYSCGLYEETLDELSKSGYENVVDIPQLNVRSMQLMAEAHAMRAHCLEKLGRSWRGKQSLAEPERKKEIMSCYHKSADMAIAYFQGQEKLLMAAYPVGGSSPHPVHQWEKRRPSSLIEFAIRRGPTLLIEDGYISDAIVRLQKLLRTTDTHFFSSIRLLLFRRLAELLLRDKWIPNTLVPAADTIVRLKYHVGTGLFNPHNVWEEIFLVLYLSQSMVVKDGVLNQAPEFMKARKLANLNTAAVYDLLCLAGARWKQYSTLNECFEQALKYSFEEPYIWTQYGLSFLAAGVNSRKSYKTLIEASQLSNRPTALLLLAAKQALIQFHSDEAMAIIQKAKLHAEQQKLSHRVCLMEGIAFFFQSFEKHMNQHRLDDMNCAINSLQMAVDLDPLDYLALHWLGRVHAWLGNLNEAFSFAVRALRAFPFHLPTLQLVILLLSAQRNYTDALAVTEEALEEYPDHLGFLQMKASLDKKIFGPDVALMTLKQMLVIWKNVFDDGPGSLRCESPDLRGPTGFGTLQLPSPTERENSVASFRAASMAGSSTNTGTLTAGFKAESALSEIASSLSIHGSTNQAITGELVWSAQINIWITITELYLNMNKPTQAASSIEEASQIYASHPDVLYYKGRIEEHLENYKDARIWYESAVAVKPTHVKSLQNLALMQHYFGSHRLAEKTLQDSLKLDPYDHQTWYNLGKVLEALEECSEAGDCMATALEIEAVNPILPYSIIPVCFD